MTLDISLLHHCELVPTRCFAFYFNKKMLVGPGKLNTMHLPLFCWRSQLHWCDINCNIVLCSGTAWKSVLVHSLIIFSSLERSNCFFVFMNCFMSWIKESSGHCTSRRPEVPHPWLRPTISPFIQTITWWSRYPKLMSFEDINLDSDKLWSAFLLMRIDWLTPKILFNSLL